MVFRRLSLVVLALCMGLVLQPVAAAAAPDPHPLTLAARTWGLAKYFHPQVTACAVDWDQALLDALPALEAAGADNQARSSALMALLDVPGNNGSAQPTEATPQWIRDADITTPLRERLAWLAALTPQQQCYVRLNAVDAVADFSHDMGHPAANPDRTHRTLAAFRFWNAVEYFFPYKADIGRDWAGVLDELLDSVLDADDFGTYVRAMRVLTASIRDSHGSLAHPAVEGLASAGPPPFHARLLDGQVVVVQARAEAGPVHPGDVVLAVDGESIAARTAAWDPMGHGSNPVWRNALNLRRGLTGPEPTGTYRLRRPDGSEYSTELPRSWGFFFSSAGGIDGVHEARTLPDGCRMGIVDMSRLEVGDVPSVLDALADTDAIVFDIRNYPLGAAFPVANRLFPRALPVSLFHEARVLAPGNFRHWVQSLGGADPQPWNGRILVLFDERAISQSEYSAMILQAGGNAITFGSQTAAADGPITNIHLPGGLIATITGLGVYYTDGTPTQRVGIVPDLHVTPTIEGLAAGRDEVLEAALDCKWLQETPALRMPPSGLYYDRERSGEGLDIHRDQHRIGALSYGYDDAGDPVWLLAGAHVEDANWGRSFLAFSQASGTLESTPAHAFHTDFHRGPYEVACADADQARLHPRGSWKAPGAAEAGTCVLPLALTAGSEATGLWAGPPEDTGWGVSVHHANGVLSVYLYGYGNDGTPRWLLGQAPWDGSGTIDLPLLRAKGFCRACPRQPVAFTEAGILRMNLDDAANAEGWIEAEAFFDDGAAWVRERTGLRRLVASTGS